MARQKQLTKLERGDKGFFLNKKIQEMEKARRMGLLSIAESLYEIHERQLFKDILGDEEANWGAYLSQPSIFFSRNELYTLFLIAQKYLKELNLSYESLAEVPFNRLKEVRNLVSKDNLSLLEDAKVLTPRDWRIKVREKRGLKVVDKDDCEHKKATTYSICENCGEKTKL